ncbi:MAG: ribonuclease HI [Spirochaetales bacterium]|nr:ribonuclease HI [Spirochaetales bacterium]
MSTIEIFTDGGCSGNPGPGAWAYFIVANGSEISGSGSVNISTNNRMELTAVIEALNKLEDLNVGKETSITVNTDSQYVKKGITEWIPVWVKNSWLNSKKKPVKNKDLWLLLRERAGKLNIKWNWVPGHAGVDYNERCDKLVRMEIKKLKN